MARGKQPASEAIEQDPGADVAARWRELVEQIEGARTRYYVDDAPALSDAEYDVLFRELEALEAAHPELVSQDSPTQSVGGEASGMFTPVEHLQRMLSLDNAFSLEELDTWAARIEKDLGSVPSMLCELKVDGLAVDIVYERGRMRSLATRGDGRVGEDVTYNAQFIDAIPKTLTASKGHPVPDLVEVRGEVYFPTVEFEALNAELCRRLREGEMDRDTPGLLAALEATVAAQIAIDQPNYKPDQA